MNTNANPAAAALACGFFFALAAPAGAHVSAIREALGLIWQTLRH